MISLPRSYVAQIIAHALKEMPNEACGLIAGRDGQAVKIYHTTNADASPVQYTIEPGELLKVLLEIEERHWEVFVIYHSHTYSPAYPSPTDVRQAVYPESFYVIVSLAKKDNPEVRAFRIIKDGKNAQDRDSSPAAIHEVELRITEG